MGLGTCGAWAAWMGPSSVVNALFYFVVSQDLGHHFLVLSFLATV